MIRKTYGAKCHKCACITHKDHSAPPQWPVGIGKCADCGFCQADAFIRFIIETASDEGYPENVFGKEVRNAKNALYLGEPHPLIERLRAEFDVES